jgi:Outer membrane protein beta-barrel domain
MKKLLVLFTAALFVGAAANAQVTLKPHVGFNMTDVTIDQSSVSASGKAGALVGLGVQFGKKLYFEPGLQYVAKSTSYSSTIDPDFDQQLDLKGLRVPVAVGINLLGSQKSTLTLHGFGGLSAFFIMDDNYGVDINKTNWGVFAGAGLDIWKIFVDVSYEWSLSELSADAEIGSTRSLYVNAGFRFNL